jgi:hypothetical protein
LLKTLSKNNASVTFGTQSLADTETSTISIRRRVTKAVTLVAIVVQELRRLVTHLHSV